VLSNPLVGSLLPRLRGVHRCAQTDIFGGKGKCADYLLALEALNFHLGNER